MQQRQLWVASESLQGWYIILLNTLGELSAFQLQNKDNNSKTAELGIINSNRNYEKLMKIYADT